MVLLLIGIPFAAQAQENALVGIKVLPMPDNRVRLDFKFQNTLTQQPASFVTQKPQRLILDFVNTNSLLDSNQQLQKIGIGSLVEYKVVAVGNRVRTILELADTISYSGHIASKEYTLIIKSKGEQLISRRNEMSITNRPVNARFGISAVEFRGIERDGGRLIIDVSDSAIPAEVSQAGKDVVVNFTSTKIPPRLLRRFDVTDFHSPAQVVNVQQEGKNARVTIFNRGDYGYFTYQVNKQFIVDVFPLTAEEIQQEKLKKRVFTGKRISLNFQDISVRSVLQLLADFTGINIVVSDAVQGNITLRLNDLPWDQALDIILTTQNLDKRQVGNVILIDKADNLVSVKR